MTCRMAPAMSVARSSARVHRTAAMARDASVGDGGPGNDLAVTGVDYKENSDDVTVAGVDFQVIGTLERKPT
jgi:hypothetical protein